MEIVSCLLNFVYSFYLSLLLGTLLFPFLSLVPVSFFLKWLHQQVLRPTFSETKEKVPENLVLSNGM